MKPQGDIQKMSSTAKKINPKKAVCKHEGCFEETQIRGHCRKHFLSVLKGKAEGDKHPRAQLAPVDEEPKRSRRPREEEVSLDEAFSEKSNLRFEDMDYDIGEGDSEIFGRHAYQKFKKVA